MKRFFRRVLFFLEGFSEKWWYGPLLCVMAAADAFVLVVSVEALLLPAVVVKPRKWAISSLWATAGSAAGATFFAYLTSLYGEPIVKRFIPGAFDSKTWADTTQFLYHHGIAGLAFISAGPFPQHLAVAIAGLAHMDLKEVLVAILIGRGLKYFFLSWAVVHSPALLRKLRIIPGPTTSS